MIIQMEFVILEYVSGTALDHGYKLMPEPRPGARFFHHDKEFEVLRTDRDTVYVKRV